MVGFRRWLAPDITYRAACPYLLGRLIVIGVAALLTLLAGCASSRDLTRTRAAEMIGASGDFRAPVTLPLKKEIDLNVRVAEEDETDAGATGRAVEIYYQFYPQMDALRQLGLIDVRATVRKRPQENHGVWSFTVEPVLTEKGERLTFSGQADRDTSAVPLARKELVEVTGIIKTGDAIAQAQFTWKEVSTEAGRAFVPDSPEYQGLSASLQQTLGQRNLTKEFGKIKRGTATFQLYDDGWRLAAVQ